MASSKFGALEQQLMRLRPNSRRFEFIHDGFDPWAVAYGVVEAVVNWSLQRSAAPLDSTQPASFTSVFPVALCSFRSAAAQTHPHALKEREASSRRQNTDHRAEKTVQQHV